MNDPTVKEGNNHVTTLEMTQDMKHILSRVAAAIAKITDRRFEYCDILPC
jgi:hypothetical protein